ncbi:potassium-transporting ATPase subunit KdpA [Hoylesella timonensis 4401737 = DSM 22865 = JCM 15640]|uniref:Potassium-transporting ATPase potassium-binding subunit n=2 Tax=Prevotellaceae TaxID=171552 RepID=D1Q0R9_9BACT|nr:MULTISPECIES: potassium-transporting ATPase subunit KdpA [Prevotellaceae]EFA42775.1 K+-transporting ATPase, A subunit [Hallella bergensis DSM 17361]EFL46606.1 K+-transporting ATPase, A subunit [Prevotella disiens FB035-09AN]KGI59573.1 potassium ABC transporter ATPase [Prevotella sp. S7 MS 2]MCL6749281.1 potassium-transporting ATPase subunit KdpA [Prevotella sp. TCVGH]
MNTEVLGVILQIVLMVGLAWPLGKYIARVYKGERTYLDFMKPVERLMYKLSGVNPDEEMDWKKFLRALLVVNLFWFVWGMVLLVAQGVLPLNPDGNIGQTCHQAFNTCISFMVNCNLQHYSGESGLTYFTQLFVIMLFQFITAATGMAAMAGIMKGLAAKTTQTIGNFWRYLVLSTTRILLPLSLVVGMILIVEGTPMGFDGKMELTTLEGQKQEVSQGPTAAIVSIKQLGTNGGGYFGVNSSHPLENPTYLTNIVECCSILIIPMALAFAFGFYLKRRKLGYSIFGVMLFAYLVGVGINMYQEMNGNPRIGAMGIAQNGGAMEGKEVRIGSAAGALWSVTTTVTSNGSVNSMHDSTMPLSGMIEMLNMQINTWFGGVGVGWMNYFTFLIIAVFISGLMVGRTPEFLGHKVEAREMKIASMVALLHPFIILVGTALAAYLFVHAPEFVASEGGWLNNPGYHGLSEMLYEYTSSAANNGSGFEGLGDNTWFWNYSCGIVLILGRFVPIVGQVAIAGILAKKKYIPESAGTLKTDTVTFGVMTFAVIFIVAALSFFPVHALSTIAEHLTL